MGGHASLLSVNQGGQLKLGDGEEDVSGEQAGGSRKVEVLGDGNNPDALIEPDPHGGDAVEHFAGETIELPD